MPTSSRWFIRTALVYLLAALTVGVLYLSRTLWDAPARLVLLWPVYLHLLVMGWLTQLIFGVALWMFPRRSSDHPYGDPWVAWSIFMALNMGLVLRAVAEPLLGLGPARLWDAVLIAASVLQVLAGAGFVLAIWQRVRGR